LKLGEQLYASSLPGKRAWTASANRRAWSRSGVDGAGDRGLQAGPDPEVALGGALAGQERPVPLVDVGGEQGRGQGVGPGDEDGRHPGHVGGQPGRLQGADELAGGDQHLAAQVAALLLAGQLVLEVDPGRPGLDQGPGQLVGVQRPPEAGLGVGHDRHQIGPLLPLDPGHLLGPEQGVVDPADDRRDAVGRVQALVGVGVAGQVGVGRDLPAGQVDGLEAGLGHLHRLPAGQGAEGRDVVALAQQAPQPLGPHPGQGVLDQHLGPEPAHVLGRVVAADAPPAGARAPLLEQTRRAVLEHGVTTPGQFPARRWMEWTVDEQEILIQLIVAMSVIDEIYHNR
jgi:hypothetical protein